MLDYSFIDLLRTFTREELKTFKKFVNSPYFNRSEKVSRLLDILLKFHPHYDRPRLTKQWLHKKISPEMPYNEITMRRLLFDLQNLSVRFMKQVNFESKGIESRLFMTEEIGTRGVKKLFEKNMKITEQMLDEGYVDGKYCMNKFKLLTDSFYFNIINRKVTKRSFIESESRKLINAITYFISYFMIESVKHNDALLENSRNYNAAVNSKFISQFVRLFDLEKLNIFMKKNSVIGNYIVEVYLGLLRAFLYFDNEHYFNEFKKTLNKYAEKISTDERHELYARLIAYCILKNRRNNGNSHQFDRELFEVYKTVLQRSYFKTSTNTFLPADYFRNILLLGIRMKKYQWIEDFIFEHGNDLHQDVRKDLMNYAFALVNFERGRYDDSLGFLAKVNQDQFTSKLDTKNLTVRIYYEQGHYDPALEIIDSYRHFLTNNKLVSESRKISHGNFLRLVTKLIRFRLNHNGKAAGQILREIERCKNIVNKEWLLDKAFELEKRHARRAG